MLSMSIRENLELSVSLPARDGQIPQMLGHCAQHLGTQISTVLRPPSPHQCTRHKPSSLFPRAGISCQIRQVPVFTELTS